MALLLRCGSCLSLLAAILVLTSCSSLLPREPLPSSTSVSETVEQPPLDQIESSAVRRLLENALRQTEITKGYSQEYFTIDYPGGDPPLETGSCTDVVIRAFRAAGVDLQKEVHEDMAGSFAAYPKKWGLPRPDTNIDHRRVPNLQTFFSRRGKALPLTNSADNYRPGDVVSWDLDGRGMTHIGIVSHLRNERTGRYLIIHNIGGGVQLEDRLFAWKVTGHYRYFE
ncbi:MAG: DUF1287 domain-containing protein [Pyrinomonadaceae bacterium]